MIWGRMIGKVIGIWCVKIIGRCLYFREDKINWYFRFSINFSYDIMIVCCGDRL